MIQLFLVIFECGYSLVVKSKLPKLVSRVRFPLPASYEAIAAVRIWDGSDD